MNSEVSSNPFESWIRSLDGEDARELLRGAAGRSDTVYGWLDGIRVADSNDPQDLLALVNRELKPNQRFYDYEESMAYAMDCAPAVQMLESLSEKADPPLLPIIERAITLITRAIFKADDSSGMIGDQVHTLLEAHARAVRSATPPLTGSEQKRVVKWIVKYRYGGTQDFFDPDIVAYAPGLSSQSIDLYRSLIEATDLGTYGTYPLTRLAVLGRDREEIVQARGGEPHNAMVAQRLVDDLIEAGLQDDALHYARVGVELDDRGWASQLIDLLVEDALARGETTRDARQEAVTLRRDWFYRFPVASAFHALRKTAEQVGLWEEECDNAEDMFAAKQPNGFTRYLLEVRPNDAWEFALTHLPLRVSEAPVVSPDGSALTPQSPLFALQRSRNLATLDGTLWRELCRQRKVTHPEDTLPVYRALIDEVLMTTKKQHYYEAADLLSEMREVANNVGGRSSAEFDVFLQETVERNKRRPTCIAIFKRKKLLG